MSGHSEAVTVYVVVVRGATTISVPFPITLPKSSSQITLALFAPSGTNLKA